MTLARTIGDSPFKLESRNVYVWSIPTVASASVFSRLERSLSLDEKERAARFRFEHLKRSFVIARGALRILLGRYLGVSPGDVQFTYNTNGKPALAMPTLLHFNTSHSSGLAVFAFTAGCELGVDVEQLRPLSDMQNIANRFFCGEEALELLALSADQRTYAFYLCWTRKEAYIKAIGKGLSVPLDGFRVTLQPGQPARFVHTLHEPMEWKLHDLQLASNYAAALAYYGAVRPINLLTLKNIAEVLDIS